MLLASTFTTVLSVLSAVLGLAGTAGAATAIMKVSTLKTTADIYEREAKAYESRSERLELELKEEREHRIECDKNVATLMEKVTYLEELVMKAGLARRRASDAADKAIAAARKAPARKPKAPNA